jgi:hypothetical protein
MGIALPFYYVLYMGPTCGRNLDKQGKDRVISTHENKISF